jgi:ABC-type lipoprotein export system ATPase subunit
MLQAVNLSRFYQSGQETVKALDGVDLTVEDGEFLRIIGASGSGKSTLLNLLAGLDTPTSGFIQAGSRKLSEMSPRQIAAYRAGMVGMVFQSFNLIPYRSARQNVEMGMLFLDFSRAQRVIRATEMLERLGLANRVDHVPGDLSGGEQQRVAIARALVKEPELLLADEPTGNLDEQTSRQIAELFTQLNRRGLTTILVTHDPSLIDGVAGRTLRMNYGKIVSPSEHFAPTIGKNSHD